MNSSQKYVDLAGLLLERIKESTIHSDIFVM